MNKIGWNFLLYIVYYYVFNCHELHDKVQDCKLLLLSFEFCQILLKWLNIFIQNGWREWLKQKNGPFEAQNAFRLHFIHYCSCKRIKICVAFHSNIKRYSPINSISFLMINIWIWFGSYTVPLHIRTKCFAQILFLSYLLSMT